MTKAAELAKMGEVLTNSQIGGRRNMVINGAMQIAQRGTSGFTTNATYTLDRYKVFCPAASFTLSQSTTAPTDFYHSLKIENTSAATPSSGNGGNIFTTLEGNSVSQLNWGTSNAKTATLSFYVRANNTGTYCVSLENANGTIGTGSHSFVTEYTINSADTWEEKKILIPGPTVGTWKTNTTLGIVIGWTLEVGSNFETSTTDAWQSGLKRQTSNQVNWQQTASANFHLTGVQLEVGSVATPFEHRSFGEEKKLCQRYYFQTESQNFAGVASATNRVIAGYRLPDMRATPSFTFISYNGTTARLARATNNADTVFSSASVTSLNGFYQVTSSTNTFIAGEGYFGQLKCESEL